jgi:prepilin-type N-terminal cleavage/methylation domain-containing protein
MQPVSPPEKLRSRQPARAGHTLVEVLLVLTILALMAGVAIPRMAAAMQRTRAEVAVNLLEDALHFARARAIATGMRHQLTVNWTEDDRVEVVVEPLRFDMPEGDPWGAPEAPQPLVKRIPEGIDLARWEIHPLGFERPLAARPGQGEQPLTFYPEGISDSAIVIFEGGDGHRRGVRIDGFTGEIRELDQDELG